MKILSETASSQTLKVIPRSYPTIVDVVITNEDTNISTTYSDLAAVSNLGYLEIPNVYTLLNDTFYSFEVQDSSDSSVIYRGKIFVTDQDPYSINDGDYTERTKTVQYIIHGE